VINNSVATAAGGYNGFVGEDVHRVGDVVELYVYTAPMMGYPQGLQIGLLSEEKPAPAESGMGGTWTSTVPLALSYGAPSVCRVTLQSTHQFEGAPNAY
jgi:hypothetical protein